MSKYVIKVENLSKQYRLGQVSTGTISHDVNRWWHRVRGKEDPYLKIGETNDRTVKGGSDYVWALKDINFDVLQGEVLGIIGRNGAGKSTLLKILSRTTAPTTGKVKIKGRVASLLEVGTGFHPELSGRENIFLNGAILGMTKGEIRQKFEEIVDFAGVERYVDTPVKRYSSGMYVRLAFAVAAHLEPDILIVDEVLAVGDAEFQKKAIGKMKDVSGKDGRTVIFVSHMMNAVKSLCTAALFIDKGGIALYEKDVSTVIERYFETTHTKNLGIPIHQRVDRNGNGSIRLTAIQVINARNDVDLEMGKQIGLRIAYQSLLDDLQIQLLVSINDSNGNCIFFLDSSTNKNFPTVFSSKGIIEVTLSPDVTLPRGKYIINVAALVDGAMADHIQGAAFFNITEGLFYSSGRIPGGKSACLVAQQWTYREINPID
jgi:lipopolysaccharide transport system ATP-binding protein